MHVVELSAIVLLRNHTFISCNCSHLNRHTTSSWASLVHSVYSVLNVETSIVLLWLFLGFHEDQSPTLGWKRWSGLLEQVSVPLLSLLLNLVSVHAICDLNDCTICLFCLRRGCTLSHSFSCLFICQFTMQNLNLLSVSASVRISMTYELNPVAKLFESGRQGPGRLDNEPR